MSNPYFEFKQFTVHHDRCAMKVGTDGVLLGAWTPVENRRTALDVGTGTGLIALQMAQRNPGLHVTAIEVDAGAARQAQDNVAQSPWADRIEVVCHDFGDCPLTGTFDLIVSNPPYFVDALKCPDSRRNAARHAGGLNYDLLFRRSSGLLSDGGCVSVIVPSEVESQVLSAAGNHGLYPLRRMRVHTKPGKPCRRVLMDFGRSLEPCSEQVLCIHQADGSYSPEYVALTGDFYLKL